jgi:hypothetical protein
MRSAHGLVTRSRDLSLGNLNTNSMPINISYDDVEPVSSISAALRQTEMMYEIEITGSEQTESYAREAFPDTCCMISGGLAATGFPAFDNSLRRYKSVLPIGEKQFPTDLQFFGPIMVQQFLLSALKRSLGATRVA